MKTIIKFLFALLILFAFSCNKEATLDPIEQELSQDQKEDAIDLSAFEVKDNLTLAEFEAAENATDAKFRCSKTKAPVFDVVNGVEAGRAVLLRGRNGVFVYYKATNLIPGHVYTLWWVVWNNPEECAIPGECKDTDFPNFEKVKVELMYASGRIARRNGKASFLAYLRENDARGSVNEDAFGLPTFGGMLDSKTSEVHAVLRDHGPAIPGQIWDQLTSYEGGCDPEKALPPFSPIPDEVGQCGDIYAAVFAPLFIEQSVLIKDHNLNEIKGTSSTLHRNKNGISVNFKTDGLIPGNAYTLWFVVFGDAPGPPSSTHAAGLIVGGSGKGNFSGHISVGDIFDNPIIMTVFNNPLTAEVHMALRTHGTAQPGMIPDQLQTIDGGCNLEIGFPSGPSLHADSDIVGYCANIQVAMHPPVN